jgi:hypothetical protein
MASPRVTWTFLRATCVTTVVGDSCTMGPEARKVESLEVESWRGKRVWEPLKPETLKSRLENLEDLALGHEPWSRGLGN